MRQFNTITAYLILSLFRIKADRIFSGSNFTVKGFAMLSILHVLTHLELNVCLISPFEALYAVIIFYYESIFICGNLPKA